MNCQVRLICDNYRLPDLAGKGHKHFLLPAFFAAPDGCWLNSEGYFSQLTSSVQPHPIRENRRIKPEEG